MSGSEIDDLEVGFGDPSAMRYILSLLAFAIAGSSLLGAATGAGNMAGTWQFSAQSSVFGLSFVATGQIAQNGNNVSGQLAINGSPCATSAAVSGTLSATGVVEMNLNENGQVVAFSGSLSGDGDSASGTYTAPSGGCTNGDTGTWSGQRFGQTAPPTPTIANVTNAALPSLDLPPATISLAPRSMATIFGANLADSTASSMSPWSITLGGTEIHLASDTCFDSSCDLIANLIYVSPNQINFLVPDDGSSSWPPQCQRCSPTGYRIVFWRDGQRIDNRYIQGGPGYLYIDPQYYATYDVVFQVGYDCLFSFSLNDPGACGLSWSPGENRAAVGAVTNALTGQLISSQNPIHQGQLLTLWLTNLYGGVALNTKTGLMTANAFPTPGFTFGFGVAQLGADIAATIGLDPMYGPIGSWVTPQALWVGESPQFVGLDQANVVFPTCPNSPATTENRYDAFLIYTSNQTLNTVRLYLPFAVRKGDPDCHWLFSTITTLTSNLFAVAVGHAITLTASVSPSTEFSAVAVVTGMVTFFDGAAQLGTGTLVNHTASLTTSNLALGTHSITAAYGGDINYATSSSPLVTVQIQGNTSTTIASSLNPSVVGQAVTFVATVLPSTVTGTVTFYDGTIALGTRTLTGNTASISVTLSSGNHSITATYNGDSVNTSNTSPALLQVVGKISTTITLASTPNPSVVGQVTTFTATVTPSDGSGTVTFFDGSVMLVPSNYYGYSGSYLTCNGAAPNICTATLSLSSLIGGTHSITATYSGDSTYNNANSESVTQTVTRLSTATTVMSGANPSVLGQSVPFTASVSPVFASGTVTFADGTTVLGFGQVNNGQAGLSVSTLSAGTHPITAKYGGDSTYNSSSSAALTQTVKPSTTITIGSSANPALSGQSVTLTAVVVPSGATGSVAFYDGTTELAYVALNQGQAAFSTAFGPVGNHLITAVYGGDGTYGGSTSAIFTQAISSKANTTIILSPSVNPSFSGQAVIFTATVAPSAATGTVQFFDGSVLLGNGLVSNGSAMLTVAILSIGSHAITAMYGGDSTYNTVTSAILVQVVNAKINNTTVLASSVNPSTFGQTVVFAATVLSATATGTITFFDGTVALGSGTLSGGVATLSVSTLSSGTHSITATYGGDTGNNSSTSAVLTQTVNP